MNKKGFTLTELLVVIAIIGILSVLIIPNVVKVNESINERTYEQRKEYITDAAEMYASNHPDIFNGKDTAYIYVSELILENYLEPDANNDACDTRISETGSEVNVTKEYQLSVGCVTDPRTSTSLNQSRIKITKKNVGVVAELDADVTSEPESNSQILVNKVCKGIDNGYKGNGTFVGKYGDGTSDFCKCKYENNDSSKEVTGLVATNADGTTQGSSVEACVLVSTSETGQVDNWLKYGASSANWRVVGLYSIPTESGAGKEVVAKIITSSVVD